MKPFARYAFAVVCIISSLALLAGCGSGQSGRASDPAASASSSSFVVGAMDHAMDKANATLATHNITLSSGADNVPKAEITPQGDLLVSGKPVPLTTSQRAEVLAYRHLVVGIAQQGIVVGKQGARLGLEAASTAIAGAFSGASGQQIRDRVNAKTSGIRKAVAKICDRLPALMKSQNQLAADVPAFGPYADLTPARIAQCRSNAMHGGN